MKRILTIGFLLASASVQAQGMDRMVVENFVRVFSILAVFGLIVFFILTFLQRILDHRLKNKIIEKGITETLASSLLKNNPQQPMQSTIKWFCLLAATGAGLLIVYYTMPLNIHSLAIMAFSIAIGFLGYYFFMRQSQR